LNKDLKKALIKKRYGLKKNGSKNQRVCETNVQFKMKKHIEVKSLSNQIKNFFSLSFIETKEIKNEIILIIKKANVKNIERKENPNARMFERSIPSVFLHSKRSHNDRKLNKLSSNDTTKQENDEIKIISLNFTKTLNLVRKHSE